jgi:hypothetical protein
MAQAHLDLLDFGSRTDPNARVMVSSTWSSSRGDMAGMLRWLAFFDSLRWRSAYGLLLVSRLGVASSLLSLTRCLRGVPAGDFVFWMYLLDQASLPSGVTGRLTESTFDDFVAA